MYNMIVVRLEKTIECEQGRFKNFLTVSINLDSVRIENFYLNQNLTGSGF